MRKMRRHETGASTPPSTSPIVEPAVAATMLNPIAMPRFSAGKASVRIAAEFANSIAPPKPWPTRIRISHSPPAEPFSQVTDRRIEKTVKTAKPRL